MAKWVLTAADVRGEICGADEAERQKDAAWMLRPKMPRP
jgi:hypothetical protein